ncbi:homoserine dehydrogenase [Alloscardovia theropitheci]|uniref:Homoserine dehydrogenase n=1 Tax=Alloscardovia theropitheci TaxID=2496842 RepID=A0A4R0QY71_9BIFI|nr:homoserine dehydrogenase [Alloscardovia theropitheci]TCD54511.1 homoserine dehydrogenase [Alloscardovia theropitheci]
MAHESIKVALLGAGTVGSQTARLLVEQADEFERRIGARLELTGIAVLDPDQVNDPWIDKSLLTTDTLELTTRADVVVELIGGIEPARTFVLSALNHGASVVTANKALLAQHGPELYEAAERNGVDIYFEAAVGGAIPIVRPLRESMVGDKINRIMGIVNGTTNYILDEMTTRGLAFDTVLKEAQAKGFAEADPTADIGGFDAAAKAAIMSVLAFHRDVRMDDVHVEGIENITESDIEAARAMNRVIKLLAVVSENEQGISAGVYPIMLPADHQLAKVSGSFNAVFVEGEASDDLMFYGRGAGGAPTASAVTGDIVTVARHRVAGSTGPSIPLYSNAPIVDASQAHSSYMVRFNVPDNVGVLARITEIFAQHGVSIRAAQQHEQEDAQGNHELWITTHSVSDHVIRETIDDVAAEKTAGAVISIMRVFEE